GDGDLGSHRRVAGGQGRAGGHCGRSLPSAADALRGGIHPAHEPHRPDRDVARHRRSRCAPASHPARHASPRPPRRAVDQTTPGAAGWTGRERRRRQHVSRDRSAGGVPGRHDRLRGRDRRQRSGRARGGGPDTPLRCGHRRDAAHRPRRLRAAGRGRIRRPATRDRDGGRHTMHGAELMLGLLIAVAALVTIARRIGVAYPVFLVVGGLALGPVPGVPRIEIDPDVIFLIVLPPLLYIAGYFTPIRNLRANVTTISSLAVGLVVASACAVAAVAHALVPGMPWSVALVLGAVGAPPDPVA